MRIALVHSYYASEVPSGENVAVDLQAAALRKAGHDVLLIREDTDLRREAERGYSVRAAFTVATGVGRSPMARLSAFGADVVHVHNLFPNFGTKWLNHVEIPVVATMHNFRPLCARSTLFRDGDICTLCPDGDRWASVRHSCYRDSRMATLPLAWRNRHGIRADRLSLRADRLVFISPRSRATFERAGLPADKMAVIPNFVDFEPEWLYCRNPSSAWLFAGRLIEEKGILDLLDSWPDEEELHVFGDGPALPEARRRAGPGVTFMGSVPNAALRKALPEYSGLLFPSTWYEVGPSVVYMEALAAGVPVAAVAGNGVADDVAEHGTGAVIDRRLSIVEVTDALNAVRAGGEALRLTCRRVSGDRFTRGRWTASMTALYEDVLAS